MSDDHASPDLVTELVPRRFPRARAAARASGPYVRSAAIGAAFAGGLLVVARWLGPSAARAMGREGGRGAVEGAEGAISDEFGSAAALASRAARYVQAVPDIAKAVTSARELAARMGI